MRITNAQVLQADAGYRTAFYLKLSTDEGLVGWSEFYESLSGAPVRDLVLHFGRVAAGMDPRLAGKVAASLQASIRLASGGASHQAIAAIENACLDIQAKAQGVPVCRLFGGPFRERLDVYWTHCGSYRVNFAEFYEKEVGTPPIRTLDDLKKVGEEAVKLGYKAVKTNPVAFDGPKPRFLGGGFRIAPGFLDRNVDAWLVSTICAQLEAYRDGIGPAAGLLLDLNFSQRTEGYVRIARAVERFDLEWLEIDTERPDDLALIRRSSRTPIGSMESLYGQAQYLPFLERRSADVCIIDAIWNGVWTSVRIASLADAYGVNIAPHNPIGELGSLMSAHFAAAVPNFRIMELRVDEAPWTRDFLTHPPAVENGQLVVPTRPGWGSDVNEDAVRERPPRARK